MKKSLLIGQVSEVEIPVHEIRISDRASESIGRSMSVVSKITGSETDSWIAAVQTMQAYRISFTLKEYPYETELAFSSG